MVFKDFLLTDLLIRRLGHHSYGNADISVWFLLLVAHKFRVLRSEEGKQKEESQSLFPSLFLKSVLIYNRV